MKSYMIIGLGRFGQATARQLCALGAEVLAIDIRGDLVQQVSNDVTHAVVGDGQDKEVLRALGARNFDCAIIAIGDDLAASVLVTMLVGLVSVVVPVVFLILCKDGGEYLVYTITSLVLVVLTGILYSRNNRKTVIL